MGPPRRRLRTRVGLALADAILSVRMPKNRTLRRLYLRACTWIMERMRSDLASCARCTHARHAHCGCGNCGGECYADTEAGRMCACPGFMAIA